MYGFEWVNFMVIITPPTVIALPSLGLLQVRGVDAAKYLQGQLTCDVRPISPQLATLGAYCDQKGRILASFHLFMGDDNYYLSMPRAILPATMTELQKFAIFSKVTLTDVSSEFSQFGILGPHPEMLLKDKSLSLPINVYETLTLHQAHLTAIRVPGVTPRFLFIIDNAHLADNPAIIVDEFKPATAANTTEDAWAVAEIVNGIASISPETVGLFTPHQLNYPNLGAVSFNKGCYRGQEIVARMQFLGKLKQHLARAVARISLRETRGHFTGVIKPGMALVDAEQRQVGEIVMAAKIDNSPNSPYELLITVMDSAVNNPQGLFLKNAENVRVNLLTNE